MMTEPNPTPMSSAASGAAGAAAGEVSRRALFVTAGLGVCAAGAVATPIALKYAEEQAAAAAQRALQDGIKQGEQQILAELANLEGISLDFAITAAELTKAGVKFILLPVSQLAATIGGDAIKVIVGGLDSLRGLAGNVGIHNQQADQLSQLLHTWEDNLAQLPIALSAYATADINSAESYLKALKAKVDASKNGQASGSPTATP